MKMHKKVISVLAATLVSVASAASCMTIVDQAYLGCLNGYSGGGAKKADWWKPNIPGLDPLSRASQWVLNKNLSTGKPSTAGGLIYNFYYESRLPLGVYRQPISVYTLNGIEVARSTLRTPHSRIYNGLSFPDGDLYVFKTDNGTEYYLRYWEGSLHLTGVLPSGEVQQELLDFNATSTLLHSDVDQNNGQSLYFGITGNAEGKENYIDFIYSHRDSAKKHIIRILFTKDNADKTEIRLLKLQ